MKLINLLLTCSSMLLGSSLLVTPLMASHGREQSAEIETNLDKDGNGTITIHGQDIKSIHLVLRSR